MSLKTAVNQKSRFLFYDTETTGFTRGRDVLNPAQPYVVQLAAIVADQERKEYAVLDLVINNDVEIPEQASNIHGITTEIAAEKGVEPIRALALFHQLCRLADVAVAHNKNFDLTVMRVMSHRLGKGEPHLGKLALHCTMEMATPIVKLEPTERMKAAGRMHFKPPKLEEAFQFFRGKRLEGAHDALIDVRACRDIYFDMVSMTENPIDRR